MNAFSRYVLGAIDLGGFTYQSFRTGFRRERSLISALQEQTHNLRRMLHEGRAELGKAEGEACHWKREALRYQEDVSRWSEAYVAACDAGNAQLDRANDLDNRLRVARKTNGTVLRRNDRLSADVAELNGYVARLEEKLTEIDPDWKAEPSDAPDAPDPDKPYTTVGVSADVTPTGQPFADLLYPFLAGAAVSAFLSHSNRAARAAKRAGSPETTEGLESVKVDPGETAGRVACHGTVSPCKDAAHGQRWRADGGYDANGSPPCDMPEGYACATPGCEGAPLPHPGAYEPGHRAEVEIARPYRAIVSEAFAGSQEAYEAMKAGRSPEGLTGIQK